MPTKLEIIQNLRDVETRFESLLPRALEGLALPLPTGTWSVHDCLCHIAADTNAVAAWQERTAKLLAGQPLRPPGFDGNAFNEEQVALRRAKDVSAVIDEIRAGFATDLAALERLSDADLSQLVKNNRGELVEAGDQLNFYITPHNHGHMDDIEGALAGKVGD